MAVPFPKNNFTTGEISPAMLGRQDEARYASAATTVRNFQVDYVGGLKSRAGTAFVGYSKQTGRNYPPRLIDFQFSSNQGLVLEFGNFYMRCISDGAFVTETALALTAAANSNPATLTLAPAYGISSATTNVGAVISSYNTGDTMTVAGGATQTPGVLTVASTEVVSCYVSAPGSGYVPGNTVTCAGGTFSAAAIATVSATQVVSATVHNAGTGGTAGTQTVTGTTGTGTKFQASVTVSGGGITAVLSITLGGVYTVNPTTLNAEPVTGGGLSGAQLTVVMGAQAATISTQGSYTANPGASLLTQGSTSGSGVGVSFVGVFAPKTVTVATAGVYTTFPTNPASQASTSGLGIGATFTLTSTPVSVPLAVGDWVYVAGMSGMYELNNETFVVRAIAGNVISLQDVFGNAVDSTAFPAYTGGGSVARIYTLATPYGEQDLPWLKDVQSADTMSLCLVNQFTGTEYNGQDLTRTSDTSWAFAPLVPAPTVLPPTNPTGTATATGTVNYEYVFTSINPIDGTESVASSIVSVTNAVDIASTAGTITLQFSGAAGVNEYYVYKALPGYGAPVQAGAQFGYAGFTYGNSFCDSNITPDFTHSPPTHQNPFARGVITGGTPVSGGSGYTTITLTPVSATGSGGILTGVLSTGGALVGVIVVNEGAGYAIGDTIAITGNGSGAVATLQVGPEAGTYPSVPGYFQERRGYANSLNNPDTYFFSQPGAFTNFDVRNPTISSDAITGSPWAIQVNGVQWMIQTSGGLLVMTGLRAWMLVGSGSFATNVQPISPSNQNDVPQAFTGSSAIIEPLLINFDVVYVDPNNVYFFDLPYQLYTLSEPIDLTDISAHLFTGYTVVSCAYCEKPYRLIWSVRSDGALLSLTYYKTQKVQGWARHDTQGSFVSVASIIEPPVNAAYFATQRFPGAGNPYMIERMDDRIWPDAESVWAVDCALANVQPAPAAILYVTSATGLGSIKGATAIVGGSGYSAGTTGVVVDQFGGTGSGAVPTLTFVGGALTNVTFAGGSQGSGYTQPLLVLTDPENNGSGASVHLTLNNTTNVSASAAVFSAGNVGSIIRASGGMIQITGYTSTTAVTGNVLSPLLGVIPNTGGEFPQVLPGAWTMTAPTTRVSGLRHLAGITVTGLADGNVIPPTVVSADGTMTLATAASKIVVGLGFQAQFQDVPLEMGSPTVQGQRKKLTATTLRMEASRGVKVGSNQRDGSSLSPQQLSVNWQNMEPLPDSGPGTPDFPPVPYNALCTPLRTGLVRTALSGGTVTAGQICIQQDNPLPCNIVAIYSEVLPGDTPQLQASAKQQARAQ